MGNETNPAASGETPNVAVPTGETPNTPVTGETPETTTSSSDLAKELETLKAALKKANAESAAHRHKAKELDDLKAKLEADKLNETEKLQKKAADLQAKLDETIKAAQERAVNAEVKVQAAQLGFINPGLAAQLLNRSEIQYDDGEPTNIGELLKALLKANPYLAGKPVQPTSGGATNPSRSQSDGNGEITQEYVNEVLAGRIKWGSLTTERRIAIQNWQAQHMPRF